MNILVACEESQHVTIEFRKLGHNAFSCDIIDCSGGHPEWHIKQDVLPLLNGNCSFKTVDGELHTVDGKWDMIIAHPACTRLCTTGQRWLYYGDKKYRSKKISEQQKAIVFLCESLLLIVRKSQLKILKESCQRHIESLTVFIIHTILRVKQNVKKLAFG